MCAASDGEVSPGIEIGHGRQCFDVRSPRQSQWLTDVLGVDEDLAKLCRSVSGRGCSAADHGTEPVQRLLWRRAEVLVEPALIVHVRTKARAEHAA